MTINYSKLNEALEKQWRLVQVHGYSTLDIASEFGPDLLTIVREHEETIMPIKVACDTANYATEKVERQQSLIKMLVEALEIVSGRKQCVDNLLGNELIADKVLSHPDLKEYVEKKDE